MSKESSSENSNDDNPLNSILIAGIAFAVGLVMSLYYTITESHSIVTLMLMIAFVSAISFVVWLLIEFIRSGGKKNDAAE